MHECGKGGAFGHSVSISALFRYVRNWAFADRLLFRPIIFCLVEILTRVVTKRTLEQNPNSVNRWGIPKGAEV